MTAKKDIQGQRFGKLIVLKDSGKRKNSKIVWLCKCDCGNYHETMSSSLILGKTNSCGCNKTADLIGLKYGRLTVVESLDKRSSNRNKIWMCKCECGNFIEVKTGNLSKGYVKSCGCLKKHYTGEKNHMYNPDKTDEEREKNRYVLGKYAINYFRKCVFERDKYTCRICEVESGKLNAHHLDGWNWNKIGRFDIDNGVTLCSGCHKKFHGIYGNGDNTKEQFEEFKKRALA